MTTCANAIGSLVRRHCIAAIIVLLGGAAGASAAENPLRPADTSSPRALLQDFIASVDAVYLRITAMMQDYVASDRLYLSAEERRMQPAIADDATRIIQVFDISQIPPALKPVVGIERIIQLKEVLDRIELPPFANIPDHAAMGRDGMKKWRLPNTEIDIVLVESGARAGEYVISADAIARLPEFYERVKHLPYRPGPTETLIDVYRALGATQTSTVFEAYSSSPGPLSWLLPMRWMVKLPGWARLRIAGVAVWQWISLAVVAMFGAVVLLAAGRLKRRFAAARVEDAGPGWHSLLVPVAILVVIGGLLPVACAMLRISGTPGVVGAFIATGSQYLAMAWIAVTGGGILAEKIIESEHLRNRSFDSQLIRLGLRFLGLGTAMGVLVEGADELGFPAYSILAGLGVGGLAVALAARESLANLLGSMLIMFEKPFRIGHSIKVGGVEGTVEDVGFRTTRIRTSDNSLVSIPNSTVVDATVENLSVRSRRRQRFFVRLSSDTPREKIEEFVAGINHIIADTPLICPDNHNVRFNNFSGDSIDILVNVHFEVTDETRELQAREDFLLRIMDLARTISVELAAAAPTVVIEQTAGAVAGAKERSVALSE